MKASRIALSLMAVSALWAQPPQGARGRFGPPPDGFGPGGPNLERHLTKTLGLNAQQQNTVHTVLEESRVQSQGMMQQMQTLRKNLAAAVKSGDEGQIDKVTQDMATLQQQQQAIHAKGMAKIYAALSDDQKTKVGANLEMLLGPGMRGPGMRGPGMRRPPAAGSSTQPKPVQQ